MDRFLRSGIEALLQARNGRNGGNRCKTSAEFIKSTRLSLSMTQREFADSYGFDLETIKSWEQDRRSPDPINSVLLELIAVEPDAVRELVSESSIDFEEV